MQRFFFMAILAMLSLYSQANEIIPLDKGLTLAEIGSPDRQTLLIVADKKTSVLAINISELSGRNAGIVDTFRTLGYEAIARFGTSAPAENIKQYDNDMLLSPAGDGQHHIALGFNYPDHAAEIEQDEQPFIFLKRINASREKNIKTAADELLDYEIEICARPMQAIGDTEEVVTTSFGFFLCGDFTDRAMLMRQIDLDNMRSGRGFSNAKSKPGYFPTGAYLVIPKDKNEFLKSLPFALWLNGRERQRAIANQTSWNLNDIAQDIIQADKTNRPTYTLQTEQWLLDKKITQDMTILMGTPEGVLMQPPSLGFKVGSGLTYVFSGAFINKNVMEYTLERYIKKMQKEKVFLQSGDEVRLEARYLGEITMKIVN